MASLTRPARLLCLQAWVLVEGVGGSCCHCAPPGEWVWGMADLLCSEGRTMAGAQQQPQSQGSMATPVAWVVGAWVLDAEKQGAVWVGRACLCPPKVRSPSLPPLSSGGFVPPASRGSFSSLVLLGQVWFLLFPLRASKTKLNFFSRVSFLGN